MGTRKYVVTLSTTAMREIREIYYYITYELYAEIAARNLMQLVEIEINKLRYSPKMHRTIEKYDDLKRKYRRIVIKNYIILYTIDEENKIVYIAHMYYSRRNYLKDY